MEIIMIRLVLVILFAIFYVLISIPLLCMEWVLKRINRHAADISSLRIVQWGFKVILSLSGVKLTVIGEENVPKDEAVLYVPNHQSYFDIIITYARCPNLTGYIAKDSIAKVPILSQWMRLLYCLFLDRNDVRAGLKTILKGIEQLKAGISMCIFPEGTRSKTPGELLPFKEGSLKLAERSGCPIIPIAITNSAEIMENHAPWIKSCHVILQYGEPIRVQELSKEERKFLGAYTKGKIQAMLDTHKGLV